METALKVASVALVVAVFAASLAIGWTADGLPSQSEDVVRLRSLSMTGMGVTLAIGLAVGFFWLFRSRRGS